MPIRDFTNAAGIYQIVNVRNGKRYIGSAVNLRKRLLAHLGEFARGKNSPRLQNAWNKYGKEAFDQLLGGLA